MGISSKGWIAIIALVAYIAFMGGMSWQAQNQDPYRKVELGNGIVAHKANSNEVVVNYPEENTTISEYNKHIEVILNSGTGDEANRTIWVGTHGGSFIAENVYAISIYGNETRRSNDASKRAVIMSYAEWNKTLNDPRAQAELWDKLYIEEQAVIAKKQAVQKRAETMHRQRNSNSSAAA